MGHGERGGWSREWLTAQKIIGNQNKANNNDDDNNNNKNNKNINLYKHGA